MNETRRSFLRVTGVAAAGVMSRATLAWGDRIRVLGDGAGGERIVSGGQPSPELRRLVTTLRIGPARAHAGMTVLWLSATEKAPALEIATLDEARARGVLVVTERAQATVPELIVENRGKAHVVLLAGEILVGGKQNRVLKEDVLLPPLSGARNLGVYCVEQGRWNVGRKDFESKSTLAGAGLRSQLLRKTDQHRVWAEVTRQSRVAQTMSPTKSYQEIYEAPEVKEHLKDVERGIDSTPPAGASGAAVFAGAGLSGVDLFQDAALFGREWPKLLRAYALEAYRQPQSAADAVRLRDNAQALLVAAARAEGPLRGNAGVGQIFEFAVNTARGAALVFDGQVVHAAIL